MLIVGRVGPAGSCIIERCTEPVEVTTISSLTVTSETGRGATCPDAA